MCQILVTLMMGESIRPNSLEDGALLQMSTDPRSLLFHNLSFNVSLLVGDGSLGLGTTRDTEGLLSLKSWSLSGGA